MRLSRLFPVLFLSLILFSSTISPLQTVRAAPQPAWVPLSKPLNFVGQGTIELKTIYAVPNQEGTMVSFTFELKNKSSSLIDFYYYWIRLQSKSGARFPINMVDPGRTRVYPGQTETFLFYSQLPAGVKVEDLSVKLVKWDFSLPTFERQIAVFPIHYPSIPLLGKSVSKAIPLTHNALIAKVEQGGVIDQGGNKEVTLTLSLLNKGYQPIPLPNYRYVAITDQGYAYPFTAGGNPPEGGGQPKGDGSGEMVLPLMEKRITLIGTLPSTVDANKIGLYLLSEYGDDKGTVAVPITVFRTFAATGLPPVEEGKSVSFGTDVPLPLGTTGKATITFDQVQRLPWSDKDLLSARFTVTNTGDKPITLPAFEGMALIAGGSYPGEVTAATTEKYLNPGASTHYTMSAPFPYHEVFHDGSIQLKEKVGEGGARVLQGSLPKFSFIEGNLKLDSIPFGKEAEYGLPGLQRSVLVSGARTYTSVNGKVLAAYVEIKNLERRALPYTKMTAFFQTDDGSLYPAKIDEVSSLFPGGSGVITVSTEIPEEVKTENTRLLLGESIEDKGVKDMVSFALPKEASSPAADTTFDLYPYTVKFIQYSSTLGSIRLEKKAGITANFGDRKIVIQITRENGDIEQTETIPFDGSFSGEKDVGIPKEDPKNYLYINVYDEYHGAKRLIGLKQLSSN